LEGRTGEVERVIATYGERGKGRPEERKKIKLKVMTTS